MTADIFPIRTSYQPLDDERLTLILRDMLAGHTARQLTSKHRCSNGLIADLRLGRREPARVANIVKRIRDGTL